MGLRTGRKALLAAAFMVVSVALFSPAAGASISPTSTTFTVKAGGTATESKTIGVPAVPAKADIQIAIDTTGSMGGAIAQAKAEATNLVNAVRAEIPDAEFSVVEFKDSRDTTEYLVHNGMTASAATVQASIDSLQAGGGGDFPEAYSVVFNNAYSPLTGGDIGWRSGSRKFVAVVGDAPPHDAIAAGFSSCFETSPDPHGRNAATELGGLASAQRTLFMVATNSRIKPCYDQLVAGGYRGSASVVLGTSFADQIVALIRAATSEVADVHLEVASAGPAPASASWVSFSPASTGPLSTPQTLPFTVNVAVPRGTPAGTYAFDIVAIADGGEIGHQTLTIVVPATRRDPGSPPLQCVPPPGPVPPGRVLCPPAPLGGSSLPSGRARIAGKTGCVTQNFNVTVTGRQIRRVTFFLDGNRIKTLRRPNAGSAYRSAVRPGRLKLGTHRIVARTTFTPESGTRPRELRLAFQHCARAASRPKFTG
ncbi:MAG: hypothetical protein ACRDLN_04925 [Solirubrobacteraceae bacterium]